jgi:hypothetical protein
MTPKVHREDVALLGGVYYEFNYILQKRHVEVLTPNPSYLEVGCGQCNQLK